LNEDSPNENYLSVNGILGGGISVDVWSKLLRLKLGKPELGNLRCYTF